MFRSTRVFAFTLALTLALVAVPALPAAAADAEGVVNINTASLTQLGLLPRVGPAVAQRIIDYREETGKFKATEELMLVSGIGERTFALLEPHVSTSGDTTLKNKVRVSRQSTEEDSR